MRKPFNRAEIISELRKHLPHTVSKKAEPVAGEEAGGKTAPGVALSPETVARLPELIQILEKEFVAKWEDISETLIFDEVGDIVEQVQEQGVKYDCALLTDWAERLIHQMENFDIENLANTFEKFPAIIQELRKIAEGYKD
ncbi:MAG: hypothetical protein DRI57_29800 [Deltaproteobacteria bacterium]|nr:MAG: hypothetical protein DRI57_29800 [Deltaproteobacteria bacterium]